MPNASTRPLAWRTATIALAAISLLFTLVPPASAGGTFTDDDHSVHEADIEWIAARDIARGCNPPSNSRYCPDDPVTRGQLAAYLSRALDLPAAPSAGFKDIGKSLFAADINRIAEAGITKGCNPPKNDRYCPDEGATRAEMAAFLVRAFDLKPTNSDYFRDDNGLTLEADINAVAAAGISVGCGDGLYCPDRTVTRAQMASFLKRALTGGVASPAPAPSPSPTPTPPPPESPPSSLPSPGASKPAGAVVVDPSDNLAAMVSSKPGGTTFYLTAGVHRMEEVEPKAGNEFVGAPGAIMSGARVLTGFKKDGGFWYVTGQTQQNEKHGTCQSGYSGCVYPEQLFIDNVELWQVTSKSQLKPGTWYFDYGKDRIYVAENPSGHLVETSVKPHAFIGEANNVTIRDLVIEKYATPANMGAIHGQGERNGHMSSGWKVVGNEVRYTASNGVHLGHGMLVKENYLHHNGRLGVGSSQTNNAVVQGNEISYNCVNTGFKCFGWGGGGVKLAGASNTVLTSNFVHHNYGKGMHTDVQSAGTLFEQNNVVANDGHGIFVEVSTNATIKSNTVKDNGHKRPQGRGAGIYVSSSKGVMVTGNVVKRNASAIVAKEVGRAPGLHDLTVKNNTITVSDGAYSGLRTSGGSINFGARNITWNNNTYDINGVSKPFYLNKDKLTIQGWKNAGYDKGSTFK